VRQRRLQSGGIAARRASLIFSSFRPFQLRPFQLHDIEYATLERGYRTDQKREALTRMNLPKGFACYGNVGDRILKMRCYGISQPMAYCIAARLASFRG